MKSLSRYSAVVWYGLLLFGLVVGILFEFNFFSSKVQTLQAEEAELQGKITVLSNRRNALSALTADVLTRSSKAAVALPAENSGLTVTSQLRATASESNVILKSLTLGIFVNPTQPEFGSIQVGVIVEGTTVDVVSFLGAIPNLSPLVMIDSVNLTANVTSTLAQVTVMSFWSPLPTKLPSINEPLAALSAEENDLLAEIDGYKLPTLQVSPTSTDSAVTANQTPFAPLR